MIKIMLFIIFPFIKKILKNVFKNKSAYYNYFWMIILMLQKHLKKLNDGI